MQIPKSKLKTASEAARLLHPKDALGLPLGPGLPPALLTALGERDDWEDLVVFAALLMGLYGVFTKPGVQLRSGFFGPVERGLAAAGYDVQFVPADFRRFTRILETLAPRVMATVAAPPDANGMMSLSLHAGATTHELRKAGEDPDRLLIVEINPALPRTHGLPPDAPHGISVEQADVIIESDHPLPVVPEGAVGDVEMRIAEFVKPYVHEGCTLQTGIGAIPSAVVTELARSGKGGFGVHSEMFTTGLMHLHEAGCVSNQNKGLYDGYSVCTFAGGSPELYTWLDGNEEVRFLPVEDVNAPERIAENENMVCINGAMVVDLAGQVVADTRGGTQYSGIGGHEDFTGGPGLDNSDRSFLCLPSTARVGDRVVSRVAGLLAEGAIVTSPRHQLDVVVTEYGAAELAGLTVGERAEALIRIAHPDFRDELEKAHRPRA